MYQRAVHRTRRLEALAVAMEGQGCLSIRPAVEEAEEAEVTLLGPLILGEVAVMAEQQELTEETAQ